MRSQNRCHLNSYMVEPKLDPSLIQWYNMEAEPLQKKRKLGTGISAFAAWRHDCPDAPTCSEVAHDMFNALPPNEKAKYVEAAKTERAHRNETGKSSWLKKRDRVRVQRAEDARAHVEAERVIEASGLSGELGRHVAASVPCDCRALMPVSRSASLEILTGLRRSHRAQNKAMRTMEADKDTAVHSFRTDPERGAKYLDSLVRACPAVEASKSNLVPELPVVTDVTGPKHHRFFTWTPDIMKYAAKLGSIDLKTKLGHALKRCWVRNSILVTI